MDVMRLLFGALCLDCGTRHRTDVCGQCFARRIARAERCDTRVIAHPEEDWKKRLVAMERARWVEKGERRKIRAVR